MNIVYIILVLLVIGMAVLFFLMVRGFRNPVEKYKVPQNLPFQIQELTIPTGNQKQLYAWWIQGKPDAPTILFIHGWGRNTQRMMSYLKKLCCKGYNLLAFDARSHGNSDPDGYTTLVMFAEDILSCVDYVNRDLNIKNNDFYLVGLSIGGASSIYAAAHSNKIKKVVTVGAFANPGDVMRKQLADRHIPFFPLVWLLFKFVEFSQKIKLNEIAPEKHIANAEAKFLLIHGEQDQTVPVEQAFRLKQAAGTKADLWVIPGRGHSNCHLEKDFWPKLEHFFNT